MMAWLELYQTPLDILYLVLTISIAFITLFLLILIYRWIRTMGHINRLTEAAEETVSLINHYLWQPIKIFMKVMEKVKHYYEKQRKAK